MSLVGTAFDRVHHAHCKGGRWCKLTPTGDEGGLRPLSDAGIVSLLLYILKYTPYRWTTHGMHSACGLLRARRIYVCLCVFKGVPDACHLKGVRPMRSYFGTLATERRTRDFAVTDAR